MSKWIKKYWWTVIVSALSITAICLSICRIEPINFDNGSMVSFVVGLMGICATIMVASQIMGLRFSESKIRVMLNNEAERLREESHRSTIDALFRVEERAAIDSSERQVWNHFMTDINLLISYTIDLNDPQKANKVARILIEAEVSFRFYQNLLKEDKEHLHSNIMALIKIMSKNNDSRDLLRIFNVLHTIQEDN